MIDFKVDRFLFKKFELGKLANKKWNCDLVLRKSNKQINTQGSSDDELAILKWLSDYENLELIENKQSINTLIQNIENVKNSISKKEDSKGNLHNSNSHNIKIEYLDTLVPLKFFDVKSNLSTILVRSRVFQYMYISRRKPHRQIIMWYF